MQRLDYSAVKEEIPLYSAPVLQREGIICSNLSSATSDNPWRAVQTEAVAYELPPILEFSKSSWEVGFGFLVVSFNLYRLEIFLVGNLRG
jgi:hypothetical protein